MSRFKAIPIAKKLCSYVKKLVFQFRFFYYESEFSNPSEGIQTIKKTIKRK